MRSPRMKVWTGENSSTSGTAGSQRDAYAPFTKIEPLSRNVAAMQQLGGLSQGHGIQGMPGDVDNPLVSVTRIPGMEIVRKESDYYPAGSALLPPSPGPDPNVPPVPPVPDSTCCTSLWVNYVSLMKKNETRTLTAEPSLYGCTYYWEILDCNPNENGCGSLSHLPEDSTERGVRYTSPWVPDGVSVNVRLRVSVLSTDGPGKKAESVDLIKGVDSPNEKMICWFDFQISVEGDPVPCICEGAAIGFTTQQMIKDERQTLNVVGGDSNCNYEWELDGEGYFLDGNDTGMSVTYVAPSSNPGCSGNAKIALKCNGKQVDELDIAITASESTNYAYRIVGDRFCAPMSSNPKEMRCEATIRYYYCDGSLAVVSGLSPCTIVRFHWLPDGGNCPSCYAAVGSSMCGVGNGSIDQVAALPKDLRSAEMISEGCCPAELM